MKNLNKKDIIRLSLKDERSFRKLYLLYKERIYFFIGKKKLQNDEINLIIQESFLAIISFSTFFDYNTGNFDSFVFAIVKIAYTNYLRKQYQSNNVDLLPIERLDLINCKYDPNVLPLSYILCDLNKVLTPDEYNVIIYRDVYNEKFKDIATDMGISKYHVYLMYKRAQTKMKKYYGNNS